MAPSDPRRSDLRDARGARPALPEGARRIVSLVPSWTETLFALGAGERVVGCTEYCVHPADEVRAVPKLGGTKNPDRAALAERAPDLVIANKEENRRADVEWLEARGIPVWVSYARSVREAVREIRDLGRLCAHPDEAETLAAEIEATLAALRPAEPRPRALALVWQDPFMAVGPDTFAHDLLRASGAANPLCDPPFDPGERRYPKLTREQLEALDPEVLLLPTEPYAFGESERQALLGLDCAAARSARVHVVEGELLSWYGPRMPRALRTFAELMT